jgi:hypothetical protein
LDYVSILGGKEDQLPYGSPITKVSPALMEGTIPSDPTSAAAASLYAICQVISRIGLNDTTHDRMSPYKLGATITSKILPKVVTHELEFQAVTYSGSRNNLSTS